MDFRPLKLYVLFCFVRQSTCLYKGLQAYQHERRCSKRRLRLDIIVRIFCTTYLCGQFVIPVFVAQASYCSFDHRIPYM